MRPTVSRRQIALGVVGVLLGGDRATLARAPAAFASGRAVLAISLSRDGLDFDRTAILRADPPPRRHEGKAKSIGYQYPHAIVVGDSLWVIYAVNKEDIELARIPLAEFTAP